MGDGLRVRRYFTKAGEDPFASVEWVRRDSRITNPDGSVVFELKDAEVPASWSQVAADIMVSKYFRKAGVPQQNADGTWKVDDQGRPVLGAESSARQVIHRLAATWRHWGERNGYFATDADAQAFQDELSYMLVNQIAAPNSPQWFNTGLNHAYGLTGPAQGFWYVDPETGAVELSPDSYTRPAPHACFIQSVNDDLVNEGGIMDLWIREARLFKFGSGTGTNFSSLRAENEPLSGGGKSSGIMSFLKIGDRAAGAIKSGGTTRRAAKMVILDVDHPDIEEFVDWKKVEEDKVRALIAAGYPSDFNGDAYQTVSGQNSNNSVRVTEEFLRAVEEDGDWNLTARTDGKVMKTVKARHLWRKIAEAAWACADPGIQFDTAINQWHTSPAGGRIRASNPCFTADTRIATDRGLIRFDDLVRRSADGETFEVYTHDATNPEAPAETVRVSQPTQVMVTGRNEILRLEFADGRTIRCTPNHRFWTRNRGWARADELGGDDEIRLLDQPVDFGMASWSIPVSTEPAVYQAQTSRRYRVELPEKWTEELGHYLGWLVGDGSLTASAAVTVYGTETEQQTAMLLHRELLAGFNGGYAPKPVRMSNGTMQLRAGRGAIRKFFEALGVNPSRSAAKRIPWSIFAAPKPIVAAFLRGLYDADGCAHTGSKNRYVGLASASQELLRDVQQLIDTFGIHGHIYDVQGGGDGFTYTNANGEVQAYASSPMFDLRITGTHLERFSALIGFGLSEKQDVLTQMLREHGRYATKTWTALRSAEHDGFEVTYNLTEPVNHSYLANGVLVSNCSEYMFVDNTACNLASLNLVSFWDEDTGEFDVEGYKHAIRLWTVVLEISVTMAHFPSKEIAQGSYDYRTVGLGYANLGSLLMRQGVPYDSDRARAITGALTAVLTGDSYAASAEMAEVLGPFPKYPENREAMLRVMRNHRRAAHAADPSEYEGVTHHVEAIDPEHCPPDLLDAARNSWDVAVAMGEEHGYRNAQATVLAPTGTIGLLMDCDTTGVEPDFALVKFKKLAGGGYFKIANQSIDPALRRLGYDAEQRRQIVEHVVGTMSLEGDTPVSRASLLAKGFTSDEVDAFAATLPGVFELRHAFNVFVVGEEALQRLGISEGEYTGFEFDLLATLGYTPEEIEESNRVICGVQTIEGAPHLDPEHLPVFDTANRNGKHGKRFIHYTGHIRAMAAAQPFISGAISKCVTGETLLATGDGLIRIGSLHRDESADSFRDEIIEVVSLHGTHKTDAFYYGGVRQVRSAVLRSGHRITGTPNHRLLTARDGDLVWRRLDEIEEGDQVATAYGADLWSPLPARFDDFVPSPPYGNQKAVRLPDEMTDDLAFLLGAYVAEGHIDRSTWSITVTNSDEGVLKRVAAAWRSEFGVEPRITRPVDRCPAVVVSSKTLAEFLEHLGCGTGAAAKRIPDAVLRSPRSMVLSFLSGLFLDGYVTLDHTDRMAICVSSNGLLDDLQAVLTNLGVVHGRVTKHDSVYDKDFDEVYAAGRYARMLARLVPFAEAHKAARAEELMARQHAQSTADIVPGIDPRRLYEMIPRGRSGRHGWGDRSRFSFLLDPRTEHVSRRTLERVAALPGVDLPEWLHTVLADGLHFSPVVAVGDAGEREVFDLSVPGTHAFVGNGIVNHNTTNMPNEVTVEDIEEAYALSAKLGLKAMALYRDGSKASQPLSSTSAAGDTNEEEDEAVAEAIEQEARLVTGTFAPGVSPSQAYHGVNRPRFLLPLRRSGWTQEAKVGGHKVFLRTGEYDDGTLGEVFIDLAKEGATLRGILGCFAIAVSKGLQYGVPLEEFVESFTFQTFEPRGMVEGHPNIKMASSIIDYVFRTLGLEYLGRTDLVQVPPKDIGELPEPPSGIAVDAGVQLGLDEGSPLGATAPISHPAVAPEPVETANGNGHSNGNGHTVAREGVVAVRTATATQMASVQAALSDMMGDAPLCDTCGHITVRNGSCYRCLNCGNSMGCS
ncbi:MAG: LAGLIDADG family homing endonuclease [Acidimicrobiia bacterium]|nr:MAG: LAGLIDADG family homing endonuclease [Acidimicrobiia bacterium]